MKSLLKRSVVYFTSNFWLTLIVALSLFHCLPFLFHYGMFFDGVTYASISRNLAEGYGSLFKLHFSDALFPRFTEHPPVAMWFHASLYKAFGQSIWVDRLPSVLNLFASLFLICKIWKEMANDLKVKQLWWVPCFLFLANELSFWIFRNNMLETTMAVFVLAASYCFIKGASFNYSKKLIWWFLGLVSVVLGVLSKGPVGFFPIMIPFYFYLLKIPSSVTIKDLFSYVVLKLLFFGVLFLMFRYLSEDVLDYGKTYFENKISSNLGRKPLSFDNLDLIVDLYTKFLLWVGFLMIAVFILKKRAKFYLDRYSLFFLVIAISGSLPVSLSQKRSLFYIFPSLAFYAFFFGFLFRGVFNDLHDKVSHWASPRKSFLLFGSCLILSLVAMGFMSGVGATQRTYVSDVLKNDPNILPENRSVGLVCPQSIYRSWAAISYAQRFQKISYFKELAKDAHFDYLLTSVKPDSNCVIPNDFKVISHLKAKKFLLYKRVK